MLVKYLATLDLRLELPDAFQGAPVVYHAEAVEELRKYVRLLGSSLAKKDSNVLVESAKTYRTLAEEKYCEQQPLIPVEELTDALAAAGVQR